MVTDFGAPSPLYNWET